MKNFLEAVEASGKEKTKPYDTAATILRVEGDTAYVHIPGGVDETPAQLTIDAKPGDTVRVRVANNQAWITGNGTAPPTDDTVARESAKTATDYVTDTNDGIFVHRNNDNQNGVRIRNNVDIVRNGKSVANYGENARIGRTDGARVVVSPDNIQGINAYGARFFSVDMDGEQKTIPYSKKVTSIVGVSSDASMTISDSPDFDFIGDGTDVFVGLALMGGGFIETAGWSAVKGTAKTENYTSQAGTVFTLVYDGKHSFTVTWNNTMQRNGLLRVEESPTQQTPSLTFGTRVGTKGAFTSTFGKGLTAETSYQFAVGAYNKGDSNNVFEVGYGDIVNPKNVFSVDTTGNITAYNHPTMIDCGLKTGATTSANSYQSFEIGFTKTFTSAPIVTATIQATSSSVDFNKVQISVYNVTATGFYVRVYNGMSSQTAPNISWIAVLQ